MIPEFIHERPVTTSTTVDCKVCMCMKTFGCRVDRKRQEVVHGVQSIFATQTVCSIESQYLGVFFFVHGPIEAHLHVLPSAVLLFEI